MTAKKRTAGQILSQEPETVELGGETFEAKPLVIKKARKFRKAIMQTIAKAGALESAGNMESLVGAIEEFFDKELIDLCKLALPEFSSKSEEWIENNVTEAELQNALVVAITVNFPWLKKMAELGSLGQVMNKAKQS